LTGITSFCLKTPNRALGSVDRRRY